MSATPNAAGNQGSPYQVPPEPNRWPAIGMAVGVHAVLLAFLYFGISWQNNAPVAVEAEVWDVTTQTAAPPPPAPPPPREAEPEPTPPPPVPKTAPPREVEQPVAPKAPDIALEREKKRKEDLKKQRLEEERQERERERELAEKREAAKKQKQLVEQKLRELEEQKKQELARKQEAEKKDLDKKKLAEKEKAEKADKLAKEKAENAKLAKLRDAEMKRMMEIAGNGTSGTAEKSTAPRIDKGYTAAITAKVKGNTSYAGSLDEPGNPTASFRVEQLPTGEIISVKKVKSSGVPSFDDAVEKGITKSSPLPKKKDGTVERSLLIEFHMKDLQ